jgi:hypothetical protein
MKLIFCSSISSQLGADLALTYLRKYEKNFEAEKLVVFIFPPANAIVNGLESEFIFNNSILTNKLHVFLVKSFIVKIFIVLALYLFELLPYFLAKFIFRDIEIYEPRPLWYRSIIGTRVGKFFLKVLYNKFIKRERGPPLVGSRIAKCSIARTYFGDGFSTFCSDLKPFWLKSDDELSLNYFPVFDQRFAFTFALDDFSKYNHELIDLGYCKEYIHIIYESWFKHTILYKELEATFRNVEGVENLFIFTGTTLTKSGRLNNLSESQLYINYILASIAGMHSNSVHIFLKFHPAGDRDVSTDTLFCLAKKFPVSYNKLLDSIPLEFILLYLTQSKKMKNIYCTAITSGVAFSLLLVDCIVPVLGFGRDLNRIYIESKYLLSRNTQEDKIADILKL